MPTEEIILNISVSEWKRDGGSTLEAGSQPLPDFQTSHNCTLRHPGSCFSRHQAPLRTVCWLSVAREQGALATLPPACPFPYAPAQGVSGRVVGADGTSFVSAWKFLAPFSLLEGYKGNTEHSTEAILQSQKLLKIFLIKVHMRTCELQRTPSCFSC